MEFSKSEQLNLDNLFCCLLAKGTNEEGEKMYVYFGIHVDNLMKVMKAIEKTGSFNPKDFQAAVLARSVGEPPQEVQDFMRDRFSFHTDRVILELAS